MDKLSQLQRRKAELKAQIEQQRLELKETFAEVRKEIEPGILLRKAVSGALGFSKKKTSDDVSGVLRQLPAPVAFVVDLLAKDPKWALGLELIAPLAMKLLPNPDVPGEPAAERDLEASPRKSVKAKLYGRLRKSVSSLRSRLRDTGNSTEKTTEQPEN